MTATQIRLRRGVWIKGILQAAAILVFSAVSALGINALRPSPLPLSADWSMKAQVASASIGDNPVVPLEEAASLQLNGDALFIDARPEDLYAHGHIAGAKSLPMDEFDARFGEVTAGVPADARIVVYCDGEACGLSKDLAVALAGKGFTHVSVLLNGWTAWQEAMLPI